MRSNIHHPPKFCPLFDCFCHPTLCSFHLVNYTTQEEFVVVLLPHKNRERKGALFILMNEKSVMWRCVNLKKNQWLLLYVLMMDTYIQPTRQPLCIDGIIMKGVV